MTFLSTKSIFSIRRAQIGMSRRRIFHLVFFFPSPSSPILILFYYYYYCYYYFLFRNILHLLKIIIFYLYIYLFIYLFIYLLHLSSFLRSSSLATSLPVVLTKQSLLLIAIQVIYTDICILCTFLVSASCISFSRG